MMRWSRMDFQWSTIAPQVGTASQDAFFIAGVDDPMSRFF